MTRPGGLLATALCAALLLAVAPNATAQLAGEVTILADDDLKPVTMARTVPESFEIGLDGRVFFAIQTSAAGYTAAERARIVNMRIVHIISYADLGPSAVRIVAIRGKPTIYVDRVRLVTVYPNDVEAAGAGCMWQLAEEWAASLVEGLPAVAPWHSIIGEM